MNWTNTYSWFECGSVSILISAQTFATDDVTLHKKTMDPTFYVDIKSEGRVARHFKDRSA